MSHHNHICHMHPLTLVVIVPNTTLTDRAQRACNWWRKMPYISVLLKYLPECCVIKYMHKKLDMIFVVTNFI